MAALASGAVQTLGQAEEGMLQDTIVVDTAGIAGTEGRSVAAA